MAAPAQSTGMAYTDEELKAKGYSQSEIDRMRARISGAKVSEGIDGEEPGLPDVQARPAAERSGAGGHEPLRAS